MEYVGFLLRNIALTIDTVIFICLYIAINSLFAGDFFTLNLIYQAICLVYFVGLTASPQQGTIGQNMLKIKVGDLYGQALSPLQSLFRYIVWGIPFWPLVVYSSLPYVSEIMAKFDAVSNNPELIEGLLKDADIINYMAISGVLSIAMLVGSLVWYLPILFMKEKTGLHDLICKQRVFKKEC